MNENKDDIIRELVVGYGEKLTDRSVIEMLSDIARYEDINFASLLIIDKFTGVEAIGSWVNEILTLRVSRNRKGRKEIIETIQGLSQFEKKGRLERTSMAIKKAMLGEEE